MLTLEVTIDELYNEETQEFIPKTFDIEMEHSLVSLSKWESFYEKPFLAPQEKTDEELLYYVRAMVVSPSYVPPEIFGKLSQKNVETINNYINAKMTATTFNEFPNSKKNHNIITSELFYYMMFTYNIPMECQHWHLNRLTTLIRVFNVKNAPEKKMSRAEALQQQRALNEQRRRQYNTSG